jgi:hypothetical protein
MPSKWGVGHFGYVVSILARMHILKNMFAKCFMFALLILTSACGSPKNQVATITPTQCEQINILNLNAQVGFREIFPGKTLPATVQEILGPPRETSTYEDLVQWIYDDVTVSFKFEKVVSVSVHNKSRTLIPLIEIIQQYGCPEAVYAFSGNEDFFSQKYSTAMLIYAKIGLTVYTDFPTSLDKAPNGIDYYISEPLDQYIRMPGIQKERIEWNDLITESN